MNRFCKLTIKTKIAIIFTTTKINLGDGYMANKETVEKAIADSNQFINNTTAEQLVTLADDKFASGVRNGWYGRIVDGIANFGYSVRNATLVLLQNPESSRVNSMNGWNYNGRAIAKGQKGMKIVAPVFGENNKATGYKISYAFDISQTSPSASGKGTKEVHCNKEFIEKHFGKIKEIVASCAKGYAFSETANSFDYEKTKQLFIDEELSPTEQIACMIGSIADMKVGVKQPQVDNKNPNVYKIDDTKASSRMTSNVISYIACRQLGIDSVPLSIPSDFAEYTDEEVKKLSSNLNFAKGVASNIVGAVENYVIDIANASKIAEATRLDEQDNKIVNVTNKNTRQNDKQSQMKKDEDAM